MTLSEVLLLLTLLWDVMKGSFDIVMKLSNKEHDDNKKDCPSQTPTKHEGQSFLIHCR